MTDLTGETAIVTGAAQGIGRGIAERLGGAGANVVLADVQDDSVSEAVESLRSDGVTAEAVGCDVTDRSATDRLARRARDRFGTIEILVNNAGVGTGGGFTDLDPGSWDHVIAVNLTGAYNCSYSIVPDMMAHGNGRVVNISSMAGRNTSYHGAANYTASKWGVIGLTKHMAWDLGEHGITVNAVCPGSTLTDLTRSGTSPEDRAETAGKIPLGRWADPVDQANGVVYLVSEEGSYLTGTVLEIDGGKQLGVRHDL